jgi:molybdopterin biosynthesis enzyme
MLKRIKLQDAVGAKLAHDVTEILPGKFKGPAFRKGHVIARKDLHRLRQLGKNSIYAIDLEEDEIHEDDAAVILAESLAGPGVTFEKSASEGRVNLFAAMDGLLSVKTKTLKAFNTHEGVSCASLHTHTLVTKGETVSATRAIPLVMKRAALELAAGIARRDGGAFSVQPLRNAAVGVVITGNEVYHGLVEDSFAPILTHKIADFGSKVVVCTYTPDDVDLISREIRACLSHGCDMILVSGGLSVDPDDQTLPGVRFAGADEVHYGTPVFPGAMFLVAYFGGVPLLGLPGCVLYHQVTALDLILPRILAGEKIGKAELAAMGHGGLCKDCPECTYPRCSFGKIP